MYREEAPITTLGYKSEEFGGTARRFSNILLTICSGLILPDKLLRESPYDGGK